MMRENPNPLWNPEFRKSVRQSVSPAHLIVTPLIISALWWLCHLAADDRREFMETATVASVSVFALLLLFWGSKLAADALTAEVNHGTWDALRMTRLTPAQILLGKLFGAPAPAWYGGLISLAGWAFFSAHLADSGRHAGILVNAVLLVILCHSLALFISALAVRRWPGRGKVSAAGAVLGVEMLAAAGGMFLIGLHNSNGNYLRWYSAELSDLQALALVLTFLIFWVWVGAWRSLRHLSQYETVPVCWLAFLFSVCLFFSGFAANFPEEDMFTVFLICLYISYGFFMSAVWLSAFLEPKEPVRIQRMWFHLFQDQNPAAALSDLPLWAAALMPGLVLLSMIGGLEFFGLMVEPMREFSANAWGFSLLFFVLRDLSLLFFLHIGAASGNKTAARADGEALIYLTILYALCPAIWGIASGFESMGLFWPVPGGSVYLIAPQAIIGIFFLVWRWKTHQSRWPAHPMVPLGPADPARERRS